MKKKLLKEKGGVKVYVIIIVVLVVLCVALGAFAVINMMNKDDDDDDDKKEKKNETTNVVKNEVEDDDDDDDKKAKEDKDDKKDKDDKDDKGSDKVPSGMSKYSGELDMEEIMGNDSLDGSTWTLSVIGNEDEMSELIIEAELEGFLKKTFDEAGGKSSGYTYDEFVKMFQDEMDGQMEDLGKSFVTAMGISKISASDTTVKWSGENVLQIKVDLSGLSKSDFNASSSDDLLETVVESFEDVGVSMKKVK